MLILFQGDSITDTGRNRQSDVYPSCLGYGYVQLIGAQLMCDEPETRVLNRGVTGNRISDMYGRWIEDTLNMDFDVLSVLCGINDVGFAIRKNRGSDAERFRFIYRQMLLEAKQTHPGAKLVLIEPFLFKMDRTLVPGNEDIPDHWEQWNTEMQKRRQVVRALAEEFGAVFVPMGEIFEELCKTTKPEKWSVDGIHLTSAGHELLARKWLQYTEAVRRQMQA